MRRFYVSDEIADDRDFLDTGIRKFDAGEFILDQYHQFELIEPVEAKIAQVHFIRNLIGVNIKVLGNYRA